MVTLLVVVRLLDVAVVVVLLNNEAVVRLVATLETPLDEVTSKANAATSRAHQLVVAAKLLPKRQESTRDTTTLYIIPPSSWCSVLDKTKKTIYSIVAQTSTNFWPTRNNIFSVPCVSAALLEKLFSTSFLSCVAIHSAVALLKCHLQHDLALELVDGFCHT